MTTATKTKMATKAQQNSAWKAGYAARDAEYALATKELIAANPDMAATARQSVGTPDPRWAARGERTAAAEARAVAEYLAARNLTPYMRTEAERSASFAATERFLDRS